MELEKKQRIVLWANAMVDHITSLYARWGDHLDLGFATCGELDLYTRGVFVYDGSLLPDSDKYDSLRTLAEALDIPEEDIEREPTGNMCEFFYYQGIRFYQIPNKYFGWKESEVKENDI